MKILVIQETDWELRGPHTQHHLMERMVQKGHKVKVIDYEFLWNQNKERKKIFTSKRNRLAESETIHDIRIPVITPGMIKLPLLSYLSIPFTHYFAIKKEIKAFKPNIIICFGILNAFIGLRLAKKNKIPSIYYLIDHLHTLLPIKLLRFAAKIIESSNIRKADKLFATNIGLLEYAKELGRKQENGVQISNGVDINKYKKQEDWEETRNKLNIKKEDVVLMFMGWIYDFSGMKEITDYMVENEKALPQIKILIVGDGDLYEYIKQNKAKLADKDKIILTGRVPFKEIPKYLHSADYCLLPAYNNKTMENIVPIKLYEYLAAGKPVICTKLKGIKREFGENSGIIYIDNPYDVYDIVKRTLDQKDELSKKSINSVKKYDWKNIVNQFEKQVINIIEETNTT